MEVFCWVGEAWRVARMQVIVRVVSVPRDTTQWWVRWDGCSQLSGVHKKKVGNLVLGYLQEWESLIVAAIAGPGHGKVGRGV
jgi:hypothetical protein